MNDALLFHGITKFYLPYVHVRLPVPSFLQKLFWNHKIIYFIFSVTTLSLRCSLLKIPFLNSFSPIPIAIYYEATFN